MFPQGPLILLLVLLVFSPAESRWTWRPRRTTTPRSTGTTRKSSHHQHVHHWTPLLAPPKPPAQVPLQVVQPPVAISESPQLTESFDRRSADGQYEFRYQLDNGNTRYERAFWLPTGKDLVLAKKGFYSVPLPNNQFSTVFYTADHRGYHVDMHTLSGERPQLPRNLEVPQLSREMPLETGSGTKRNSISDPERNELDAKVDGSPDGDGDGDAGGSATKLYPNAETESQTETQTEAETEPSTVPNDILATDSHVDVGNGHGDDDDVQADEDKGNSNRKPQH
ncbi:hypothetical protein KR018_005184 [Drosophila ironensis]|nr:hypothetical protein KR018_005184 [Drosophila ironensis]